MRAKRVKFGQKAQQTKKRSRGWRTLGLIVALIATVATAGSSAQGRGPDRQVPGRAHVESALAERLSRLGVNDLERVIITVKPGLKTGLVNALVAQGATDSSDFELIEAFAVELPVGLLRALEKHPDVVSISLDAPVYSTGVVGASGNA